MWALHGQSCLLGNLGIFECYSIGKVCSWEQTPKKHTCYKELEQGDNKTE